MYMYVCCISSWPNLVVSTRTALNNVYLTDISDRSGGRGGLAEQHSRLMFQNKRPLEASEHRAAADAAVPVVVAPTDIVVVFFWIAPLARTGYSRW